MRDMKLLRTEFTLPPGTWNMPGVSGSSSRNSEREHLVEARRTIYIMTLKGQGQSLTSGQVRPRSRDDRNGLYCISVDSPGRDERTDTTPTSLSLFDQKLLSNDGW